MIVHCVLEQYPISIIVVWANGQVLHTLCHQINTQVCVFTFSYLQYVQICARTVRNALKEEQRLIAQKRDEQGLKYAKWEGGKQGELVG